MLLATFKILRLDNHHVAKGANRRQFVQMNKAGLGFTAKQLLTQNTHEKVPANRPG